MNRLTKHEQLVLCGVFGLLLVGLAVKTWRTSHPPATEAKLAISATTNSAAADPQ
jgi:hypothetical protein